MLLPNEILQYNKSASIGELNKMRTITSGVYAWKAPTSHEQILSGNTTFLEPFQVSIETVKPGQKSTTGSEANSTEELLIVKEGQLTVSLEGKSKSVGAGSIVFLMPNEKCNPENKGSNDLVLYRLRYTAKSGFNLTRGESHGGSFIVDWDEMHFQNTDIGGRRDLFDKPTATCTRVEMHVTTLNAGLQSHAPHQHADEELILLLKGNLTMTVAGKKYPMAPGDFVFIASRDFHGLRNTGKDQCEYFALQWDINKIRYVTKMIRSGIRRVASRYLN